jgi:hypothetical protein
MTQSDIIVCYHPFDLVELGQMCGISRLIPDYQQSPTHFRVGLPEDPINRKQLGRLEPPRLIRNLIKHIRGNSSRMRPEQQLLALFSREGRAIADGPVASFFVHLSDALIVLLIRSTGT